MESVFLHFLLRYLAFSLYFSFLTLPSALGYSDLHPAEELAGVTLNIDSMYINNFSFFCFLEICFGYLLMHNKLPLN
jgi:hypothetical protein